MLAKSPSSAAVSEVGRAERALGLMLFVFSAGSLAAQNSNSLALSPDALLQTFGDLSIIIIDKFVPSVKTHYQDTQTLTVVPDRAALVRVAYAVADGTAVSSLLLPGRPDGLGVAPP